MAKNYYALVAGLREFAMDSEKKGFDARVIIEEIRSELGSTDRGYLRMFYLFYDIENIVNMKSGRAQFSELGNFSREQLEMEIRTPSVQHRFIANILEAYNEPDNPEYEEIDHTKTLGRSLYEAYYRVCEESKCRFIREWYRFDRNLRNVIAAYGARRAQLTVADQLVGDGYVVDTLARSSAADFGLKGELDYIDDVITAMGGDVNLLEKERRLDTIRWDMSDELTPFDYFNINTILAYLVKINIVHRWVSLDEDYGREMFRKLMAELGSRDLIERAGQ